MLLRGAGGPPRPARRGRYPAGTGVEPDLNVIRIVPMPEQVSANFRVERLMTRLTTFPLGKAR
jgi:hypothetical protein